MISTDDKILRRKIYTHGGRNVDFEHRDHRIHTLNNAVKLKGEVQQKLPVNPEMLRWGETRMNDIDGDKWRVAELWAAIMVEFHCALRIGELGGAWRSRCVIWRNRRGNLRYCDYKRI